MARNDGELEIKWRREGFREIRQDHAVQDELDSIAKDIAWDASEQGKVGGYIVTTLHLEDPRGATSVMATDEAVPHNRKHHALIRAVQGVRHNGD